MNAREIMQAAEQMADAVSREALPLVATKDCRRCKGTGVYTFVSGAKGECNSCDGGKVPATKEGKVAVEAAKAARELKRLRLLWVGARDALKANPSKHLAAECTALMASVEARAVSIKRAGKVAA